MEIGEGAAEPSLEQCPAGAVIALAIVVLAVMLRHLPLVPLVPLVLLIWPRQAFGMEQQQLHETIGEWPGRAVVPESFRLQWSNESLSGQEKVPVLRCSAEGSHAHLRLLGWPW